MKEKIEKKVVPVTPLAGWEYQKPIRYFSMDNRPAFIIERSDYDLVAYVKNKGTDEWHQLHSHLDVEHDKDGSHSFGTSELTYEDWIDIFGHQFEWTEIQISHMVNEFGDPLYQINDYGLSLIDLSLWIATTAHKGQVDKAGRPYILHPIRLMMQMDTDVERSAALLHDVIEDTAFSRKDLESMGIPDEVLEALELLTKPQGKSYMEFVSRVKSNPVARKVKIADITDNMNINRLENVTDTDLQRVKKYHKALKQLMSD